MDNDLTGPWSLTRRQALGSAPLAAVAMVSPSSGKPQSTKETGNGTDTGNGLRPALKYCLNTSTLRGQKRSLIELIEIAAQAGYDGIEPWIREIDTYLASGGTRNDLKKRIADHGLVVESAIGFSQWIVDDPEKRAKELENAKRDMDLVAEIGGTRIAAPPAGATRQSNMDLMMVARRYRALLELGRTMHVVPQLELWGFSKTLSRLGELALVAIESGHPDACLLPDVFHIYKGGSDFTGLRLIAGTAIHVFHVNDYPAHPPRDQIADADRVFPGDGVAPLGSILKTLVNGGFRGALSLELFNRDYWQREALAVAREGLEKMRAAVQQSLEKDTD